VVYHGCGFNTPFESAFFYALPHARCPVEKAQRSDHPLPVNKHFKGVTIRYVISKGGIPMDEMTIGITEKVIGDTLYIIESAVSSAAKESAYDKLKRMIMNATKSLEIKAS